LVRKFALKPRLAPDIVVSGIGAGTAGAEGRLPVWNKLGMAIEGSLASRPARVEWPTVVLIVICHGGWLAAGALLWASHPVIAVAALTLAVALQSSLMHEASHGHPTRNAAVNELLVSLPLGLVYPYRRFKALHMRHHADERLTDPFDDPESYYRALWQHERFPLWFRALLSANNSMVGRFLLGPALASVGFFLTEAAAAARGDHGVRRAWIHHLAGLAVVLPVVHFVFDMPLVSYLVPAYLGQSLLSVRTFAEHQWSERPDGRTIIVERSPLALLFLNNNLHLVHHKMPAVAWYKLPRLFRERRAEWTAMNGGYVFPNYLALLRQFAFRAKEPVVHPALRRAPEQGRAFRPRARGRNVAGHGAVPVPAKPADE
jgi:fatty acid desaturase